MAKVTGVGGVFFKSRDAEKLYAWYEEHLGLKRNEGAIVFEGGMTVWSIFPRDTKYFDPSRADFMVNYRVDDLDGMLDDLRKKGVEIDEKREDSEYGRFAWIMDPEGNRIELWQPPTQETVR